MININNNNILYSEVAPLTGDVISPSFRDRKKIITDKNTLTERPRYFSNYFNPFGKSFQ